MTAAGISQPGLRGCRAANHRSRRSLRLTRHNKTKGLLIAGSRRGHSAQMPMSLHGSRTCTINLSPCSEKNARKSDFHPASTRALQLKRLNASAKAQFFNQAGFLAVGSKLNRFILEQLMLVNLQRRLGTEHQAVDAFFELAAASLVQAADARGVRRRSACRP